MLRAPMHAARLSDLLSSAAGALFDLDGVLLDTEGLYTEATQAVVGRFGKTYDWSLKRHTMGRDARESARFLLERLGIPLSAEEFLRERDPVLRALLARSPVRSGAETFVRGLESRGKRMAVATSSDRHLYGIKIAPHGFFERFHAVVCGDDPGVTAKKPAPDIFVTAARALGVSAARCVVFEDSPAGVEAALRAGMRVVVLPDPAMNPEDFPGADAVVPGGWEALTELLG